jgi:hypothetical protein
MEITSVSGQEESRLSEVMSRLFSQRQTALFGIRLRSGFDRRTPNTTLPSRCLSHKGSLAGGGEDEEQHYLVQNRIGSGDEALFDSDPVGNKERCVYTRISAFHGHLLAAFDLNHEQELGRDTYVIQSLYGTGRKSTDMPFVSQDDTNLLRFCADVRV